MIDPADLAAAASVRLKVPAADLLQPATAALEYIAWNTSTTVELIDDSALTFIGARLLTERIYLDVPTSTGELDAPASVAMSGLMIPTDLGADLRYYWTHEQHAWGIG